MPVIFDGIHFDNAGYRIKTYPNILKNMNMNKFKKYAGIFIIAAAGSVGGTAAFLNFTDNPGSVKAIQQKLPVRQVSWSGPSNAPVDFVEAANQTIPAVVHVKTTYPSQRGNPMMDPFGFFWGPAPQRNAPQQQSSGSGVIISDDGYIVTNHHVIEDADAVQVTLDDKRTFSAKVIGKDPSTDLALLKIDAKDLPFAAYGNSDNVKVGEWVLAVGNPFNLTSTVTAGIVSAKARNIHILPDQRFPIESFIQTDAAVNPGNSGGALVNTRGELIAINAAIASTTGSYAGYAFAIPVNIVKKVVDDLLEYGNVQRGFIGVSIRDIDADFARENELPVLDGVYVNGLTDGGAASSAGIKTGDIITRINDVPVRTSPELQEQVGRYRPGDKIDVTYLRDKKERETVVTLRNFEGNTSVIKANEVSTTLGATLEPVNDNVRKKLGINKGVVVKELNSGKLRSAGIREGFIITAIDNKEVASSSDVMNYLQEKKGGVLIEGVYPNGLKAYYGFGM